jgi:hypothetical protein
MIFRTKATHSSPARCWDRGDIPNKHSCNICLANSQDAIRSWLFVIRMLHSARNLDHASMIVLFQRTCRVESVHQCMTGLHVQRHPHAILSLEELSPTNLGTETAGRKCIGYINLDNDTQGMAIGYLLVCRTVRFPSEVCQSKSCNKEPYS